MAVRGTNLNFANLNVAGLLNVRGVAAGSQPTGSTLPSRVDLLFPTALTERFVTRKTFLDELKKGNTLIGQLKDERPKLTARATEEVDGRRVPVVIVLVRDPVGATRPGLLLQLFEGTGGDAELVDQTRTDRAGVALLRYAEKRSEKASGEVALLTGEAPEVRTYEIDPAKQQHAIIEFALDALPALPVDDGEETGEDGGAGLLATSGQDPLLRLPADFTPRLCADVTRLRGGIPDPLLGRAPGSTGDFRARRAPLVRRFETTKLGELKRDGERRRYLVRVRQEWTFLGYTLGELAQIDNLDPGSVVREVDTAVERAVDRVSEAARQFTQQARRGTTRRLTERTSVRSFVNAVTETSTVAGGGGGFFILPPFFLGGGGGGSKTTVEARTRSGVDTSLEINAALHSLSSVWNEAVSTATSSLQAVENAVSETVGRVSPLLSRVTNLLRWRLYESYAVCTQVEDVVELISEPLIDRSQRPDFGTIKDLMLGQGMLASLGETMGKAVDLVLGQTELPSFTDEDIVEYRRIFEPDLLDPTLADHFDVLAQALARSRAAAAPISRIDVDVDYSGFYAAADLTVRIADQEVRLDLRRNRTRARGSLHLAEPLSPADLGDAELLLSFRPLLDLGFVDLGRVRVRRIRFGYHPRPPETTAQVAHLSLSTSDDDEPASATVELTPPQPAIDTSLNPLFRHVNRNATYYFGLLVQAALRQPALRDDSPHLSADFPGSSDLWKLPIVGFEGDRVLVLKEPEDNNADVQRFLEDIGAATVVQLAAPGTYGEALEGLLSLTDAKGKIHPNLIPPPPQVVPPIGLIDVTKGGVLSSLSDGNATEATATDDTDLVDVSDADTPVPGGGG